MDAYQKAIAAAGGAVPKGVHGRHAVAALPKDKKKFKPATAAAVAKMLQEADKGTKKDEKIVNGRVHLITRQSDNNVFLFETRDRERASKPVHGSGK